MIIFKRLFLLAALLLVLVPASASASVAASPGWQIESTALPTSFTPANNAACPASAAEVTNDGEAAIPVCDTYKVMARNAGSVPSEGAVTLEDVLPSAGLTVQGVRLLWPGLTKALNEVGFGAGVNVFPFMQALAGFPGGTGLGCTISAGAPATITCFTDPAKFGSFVKAFNGCEPAPSGEPKEKECAELAAKITAAEADMAVAPDEELKLEAYVTVNEAANKEPEASGPVTNTATISGAGAPAATTRPGNDIGSAPAPFGFSAFDFSANGLDGARDTQAGDHPYELTTTIALNNEYRISSQAKLEATSPEDVRDIVTQLPVGFVGSILAAPECSFTELAAQVEHGEGGCKPDTIVGHIFTEPQTASTSVNGFIYNMTPEKGVPAEFAYIDVLGGAHVFYVHVVPTAKGYVLEAINPEIPQIPLTNIVVTFYGDPSAKQEELAAREGKVAAPIPPVPFFTNPTDCSGVEPAATIYMDSWQNPAKLNPDGTPANLEEEVAGKRKWAKMESKSPAVTGCDALRFTPEIEAQPTTHESDKPSGMNFSIKVPQSESVGVPGTPTLKKAVVTLPQGFTVNPAAGDGLAACSRAEIGFIRVNPATNVDEYTPAQPACPEASKIGTLKLATPLVPHELEGEMYLAAQDENPFDTTLAAYVVVNDPVTGVLIKIAGEFLPNPNTGRLTAVFDENPNLPFSNLELHFFGGPRAELATPESCGMFTTGTELEPYSAPDSGPSAAPSEGFLISELCPSGGFAPSFAALSTNVQAGAYTPFVLSLARSDADEELSGLTETMPPGLLANLASVPLCSDADAAVGACPAASQIGVVRTGVGPGPDPLFVGGKIYLTGPYKGAPFGESVVVPAVAGPYNFGTVVVRGAIYVNPHTAQATVVSDAFPKIIEGIPLRMRRVDVELNRAGGAPFVFNPTSCNKLAFTGSITGSPLGAPTALTQPYNIGYATQSGANPQFTAPFQVTNCQALKFTPKFQVTTNAKTSKANGAELIAKLSEPNEPQGSQANIARVKVELPKALPSRLTTLQKACTAKQFEANPANCPSASKIGYATVKTPILPAPLTGPAIFVSHGGEAFPSLTMVLQGDNVTIDLVGATFISKSGVTSTTFRTVPDTPFSTFELTLPQGKYSALAANGNLCKQASKLLMPTEFAAQNGAEIKETTKIGITGCKKQKKAKKTHAKKRKKA
jgi:hypothetical protein